MVGARIARHGYREIIEADLEILPMMNLFIVLIPMLLLSAVFVEISSIDMTLPSSADPAQKSARPDALELAIRIDGDAFVIEGNGIESRIIPRGLSDTDATVRVVRERLAAELASIVAGRPDEHEVRIISRPDTRYVEIIAVMDVARASGLDRVGLAGAGAPPDQDPGEPTRLAGRDAGRGAM